MGTDNRQFDTTVDETLAQLELLERQRVEKIIRDLDPLTDEEKRIISVAAVGASSGEWCLIRIITRLTGYVPETLDG